MSAEVETEARVHQEPEIRETFAGPRLSEDKIYLSERKPTGSVIKGRDPLKSYNMQPIMKFNPKDKEILSEVYRFAKSKKVKLYLVGGYLRDMLLGRQKIQPDMDFAVKKGAINFGRQLAKKMRAGFVVLDKEHGASRIVRKINDKIYTLDFTDFRGADLKEDLLHRDFTINSIALGVENVFTKEDLGAYLIDPHGASKDIKAKIVRMTAKRAFTEDPLRILRAFSFSTQLGFQIDKATLSAAKIHSKKLSKVSWERIRDELFKVFHSKGAFACLVELDKLKILDVLFPEIKPMRGIGQGPYHHLDVWQHTLETVRQLEGVIEETKDSPDIQNFLNTIISSEHRRFAILKLGAFLHDVGKPEALRHEDGKIKFHGHERVGLDIAEGIARRLKLANDEINILHKMVLWHLRPGYLADNEQLSPRAIFRYFRDTGPEAISVLLLSLADQRATKGPLTTRVSRARHERLIARLIKEYFHKKREKKKPRLVTGDDLIKQFKLEPSPLIGKILGEIEESQAIGKINTKQEALKIAKKFIK